MIVALIAIGAWCFAGWVYWRGEQRWSQFETTVIPGSPQVKVADVMRDPEKSPFIDSPVFLGRLSETKHAQAYWEREWSRPKVVIK